MEASQGKHYKKETEQQALERMEASQGKHYKKETEQQALERMEASQGKQKKAVPLVKETAI
ncbi:MAG: hypothetical protein PHF92_05300 [Bacteroidales bacterium]|nr:hypothetical protein [Bacteroidales bacterium]